MQRLITHHHPGPPHQTVSCHQTCMDLWVERNIWKQRPLNPQSTKPSLNFSHLQPKPKHDHTHLFNHPSQGLYLNTCLSSIYGFGKPITALLPIKLLGSIVSSKYMSGATAVHSMSKGGQSNPLPLFWLVVTVLRGVLHSLLILCWNTASCRSFTFFSSLLHCCSRLFFWGLLRFSSWESLRAASWICRCRARSVSSACNSKSYNKCKF